MRNLLLTIILIIYGINTKAQNDINKEQKSLESNPIVFMDFLFGYGVGKAGGFTFSPTVNYQKNDLLFTAKYLASASFHSVPNSKDFLFPFLNEISTKSLTEEFSLLSGLRVLIGKGASLSLSTGISRTKFKYYGKHGDEPEFRDFYLGVPFEASFILFNSDKERIRILYGLIPIGKPVGLSNSIGLKLYGTISRNSFIGIGLNLGYGFHKKY